MPESNTVQRTTTQRKRPRLFLGANSDFLSAPDPLSMPKQSYDAFLDHGLATALQSIFPIESHSGHIVLEYNGFEMTPPVFDQNECKLRGLTYASVLRVKVRMVVYDRESGAKSGKIQDVKEQSVFMGEVPMMTSTGSFIINGTERMVVSQLHRSPGVFFEHDKGRTHASKKLLYSARIIPYRGAWVDFEFDTKDCVSVRIDRRRKLPVSVLLRALGMSTQEILSEFYETDHVDIKKNQFVLKLIPARLRGNITPIDIIGKDKSIVVESGRRVTQRHVKKLESDGITSLPVTQDFLLGRVLAEPVVDAQTGECLVESNAVLTEELCDQLLSLKVKSLKLLYINELDRGSYISDTLASDACQTEADALVEIYRMMRPGEPPTKEAAESLFAGLFFFRC